LPFPEWPKIALGLKETWYLEPDLGTGFATRISKEAEKKKKGSNKIVNHLIHS